MEYRLFAAALADCEDLEGAAGAPAVDLLTASTSADGGKLNALGDDGGFAVKAIAAFLKKSRLFVSYAELLDWVEEETDKNSPEEDSGGIFSGLTSFFDSSRPSLLKGKDGKDKNGEEEDEEDDDEDEYSTLPPWLD